MICEQTKFDIKKAEVCNVIVELFGQSFFGPESQNDKCGFRGDFMSTPNSENSVREQIADLTQININDVERYVYLTTLNGNTIIKK